MMRREFMTLVGCATAWPLVARAQHSAKIWRIGFIAHRYEKFYDPLFQRLHELVRRARILLLNAAMRTATLSDLMGLPQRWFD